MKQIYTLKALDIKEVEKQAIVQQMSRTWFQFMLQYDPHATLSSLDIPILALNGSLDQQIEPEPNLTAIRSALKNNPNAKVVEIAGLNHLFQTAETGAMGEYDLIEETFSPDAMNLISDWIEQR